MDAAPAEPADNEASKPLIAAGEESREESKPLKAAGEGGYGATATKPEATSTGDGDDSEKPPIWYTHAHPVMVWIQAMIPVAKECVALGVIVIAVFFSRSRVMNCDSRIHGLPVAIGCETTKTFVRFLPLVALVVTLLVAARQMVRMRFYYGMLKQGAILDFENVTALGDPVFVAVIVMFVVATIHYALLLVYDKGIIASDQKTIIIQIQGIALFYLIPMITFLAICFNAYDTEAQLLPLSKYVEEDVEEARKILGKVALVREPDAEQIVLTGEYRAGCPAECQASEAYDKLIEVAANEDWKTKVQEVAVNPVHLVRSLWPAYFLLDSRIKDFESTMFQWLWRTFLAFSYVVFTAVIYLAGVRAVDDFQDMLHGQYEDGGASLVAAFVVVATAWLAWCLPHWSY